MIQKLKQKNDEYTVSVDGEIEDIRNYLLDSKIYALNAGIILSDEFISHLEDYIARNSIKLDEKKTSCCPRCIKAHAIKKARQLGLGAKAIDFLENALKCEKGHSGYYLDEDELVKI
jgi:hypothetical protein